MSTRFERYRPWLLVLLLIGLLVVGKATGISERLDVAEIRSEVLAAGPFGVLLFIAVFALGELLHVPGLVFVATAAIVYGPHQGFFVALVGAMVSVCVSFGMVRAVGGKALTRIERPWFKKILARLDARPIQTVIVLRSIMWLAPPLNYALAMTGIRFRDYVIGSSIGLVLPVLGLTFFSDLIIQAMPG